MGYRWDQPAYSLSYANRRRLEIARAMATEPRMLLLDEPAAGMNPVETHEITELIGKLRDEGGYTILVIEHDMHVVEGISDRVVALDHGVKIAEGSFEQVATDPRVVEAYLGTAKAARSERSNGAPLLRLADIDTYYGQIHILQDVDLEVGEGELVCLLGGNASGKSTTLKTILGIVQPRNGTVEFAGEDVTERTTSYRISSGMAIVPENRRLFAPMTVLENLEMGAYLPRRRGRKEDFERVYTLFPLLHERRNQLAGTLSGGEQQMVAMGRALMSRPKLLLMDEPSMGLAPILVERSFEIIKQVHEAGVAVLVVEQNANVSLSIADRGYVLSDRPRRPRRARRRSCCSTRTCGRPTLAAERRLERACAADLRSDRPTRPRDVGPLPHRIRHRFPIFERLVYINSCSQGALSDAVRDAYERVPRRLGRAGRAVGVLGRARRGRARRVRAARATRTPDEVAVTTSLSAGVSALASGLRFAQRLEGRHSPTGSSRRSARSGTRRSRAARASSTCRGRGRDDPARALRAGDRRGHAARLGHARLLPERRDARRASRSSALAHERGALVLLDAYQSAGSLPLDVRALGVDFLAAGVAQVPARLGRARVPLRAARRRRARLADGDRLVRRREHLRDGHPRLLARADARRFQSGHAADPVDLRGHRRDRADAGDRRRGHARARAASSTRG